MLEQKINASQQKNIEEEDMMFSDFEEPEDDEQPNEIGEFKTEHERSPSPKLVRSSVMSPFTSPRISNINSVGSGGRESLLLEKSEGLLIVTVNSATNLKGKDSMTGSSDPFVKLSLNMARKVKKVKRQQFKRLL